MPPRLHQPPLHPTTPPLAGQTTTVTGDPALSIGAVPADARADRHSLVQWARGLSLEQARVLGYPGALDFRDHDLGALLDVFVNNVGDPGSRDSSGVSAKEHELAVVEAFARTAGISLNDVYGYVTTGGIEGIERGLELARERLPDAPIYTSDQAHYGVRKAALRLRMKVVNVPSGPDGAMDGKELRTRIALRAFMGAKTRAWRPRPGAIILATAGTTFRGSYDDVATLRRQASDAGDVHVHVDGALGGLVAAHAPEPPSWSFTDGADSLSMSGHKILGMPVPCGVFLARRELVGEADAAAEYVGATDHTWGCSRSGLAVLLLWRRLRAWGHEGLRERIRVCLDTADYAARTLATIPGASVDRVPQAITVTFARPAPWVASRWHLAVQGDRAHIVCVSHITRSTIDSFRADLARGYTP